MTLTLAAIYRYPVKSCRGEALHAALVEPWGLAGDRRWMVVDAAGDPVTAREHRRLLLVRPELHEGGVRLTRPDAAPLDVCTPDGSVLTDVAVWTEPFAAAAADESAHRWFSELIGEPVRLVYLDDPTRRAANPAFALPTDRVSFADGYPLLLTTEGSLTALNDLIAAGPGSAEGPVPMTRFRPSMVISGSPAWSEDGWRRLRIGSAVFRCVKGCDRCVLTTVDPQTARNGREPLATLARHRKWDGKTWFGMNLVPDSPGARIAIGDEVEILDSVESDGPPR